MNLSEKILALCLALSVLFLVVESCIQDQRLYQLEREYRAVRRTVNSCEEYCESMASVYVRLANKLKDDCWKEEANGW